ncbi:PstS family phosphate ABC transporter substrate-binding protein [Brevibacillus choshinensis]|uniref:Substrate-binding domain-containing protein n=1 Tax=Brevibacillus choshinensis TaxID=54911 RepID=A0ABX7FTX4_BRECH|nr:substrate-binding domain-containing protein [Brevibacillus choshinensis]QRG69024.1 substrate-binding domain-containing protein [Brevibacillus choshinensis]
MKRSVVPKIVEFLIIAAVLAFMGFVAMVMTALMGGELFYTPLTVVITAAIIVFIGIGMFTSIRKQKLYLSLAGFFLLCGLTVASYEGYEAYVASIPSVSEQDFDLQEYKPFREQTKVKSLDEPSTLTLHSDLPRLDGATALYPLYAAFAQAVYPKKDYDLYEGEVMANTTPEAYENLMDGRVDIIFVAGPSEQQLEAAKARGVELKLTPIGREAFVFFVHAENPVSGLTTEQIRSIYSGTVTNWSQVGGKPASIRAFQRPENSGSQTMLQKVMGNAPIMPAPKEDIATGMGGIISQTADYKNYENAIGYSFLYFATEMVQNGNIRLLEVDGVMPSKTSIRNGTYPLAAEFYAVTAGSDNPNVERFLQWILSPQGQSLVEKTGYTPVSG